MVEFGPASHPPHANAPFLKQAHAVSGLNVTPVDVEDPFAFYRSLRPHVSQSFVLESAPGPLRQAEHTFMGFAPHATLTLDECGVHLNGKRHGDAGAFAAVARALLKEHRLDAPALKYVGGLVGQLGYDYAAQLEPVPRACRAHPFPTAEFGLYLDGFVHDHQTQQLSYFSCGPDRLAHFMALAGRPKSPLDAFGCGPFESALSQRAFEEAVRQVQGAIAAGDAYQIVLSRQLHAPYRGDPLAAYARLRALTPSPYMYFLDFGARAVAGSSPETLVSVQAGTVTTHPIAGTRPVSNDEAKTQRLAEELLADPKECAEHVMLVDLARNDVGRVAQAGSVAVPRFMAVERFSHVQHFVSRVEGALRPELDALDALLALFPAGTVSGAPKVRAMQWIARLEPVARGPYAGVVGYLSLNGNLDTAIAIRTAFFDDADVYLQAGAGIVADSDPAREYAETEHKLGPMRQALGGGQ